MNYNVDTENELYKEFKQKQFDLVKSKSSMNDNNPSILFLDNEYEREYKCQTCHFKLFTNNDVQRHERQPNVICNEYTRVFTFFLDWIEEIFVNPFGVICCPNCKTNIGEYSLNGLQCYCGQWIKPAFIFQCQSIE